ncbi:hypothetical protein [Streptomonospora alba]|uniref:hypothetical protein n=1 Tax=Streptomonospora alba TaxID=183763 RepID=UPI00069A31C5|nr:hypothetical protein [Streptomonospora alba]
MLTTALVLGIVGGVFGIIGGLAAMLVGGLGAAFEAQDSGSIVGWGFAAVFFGVAGIVGGALARGASKTAALLLLLSCVGGFIAVEMAWLIAGPLLIVGAGLAWFGRRKRAFGSPMPEAEPKPAP